MTVLQTVWGFKLIWKKRKFLEIQKENIPRFSLD